MVTFYTRPPFNKFDSRDGKPYLKRISSIVRGEQIANYLGAKLNPKERDGVAIYVKPLRLDNIRDGDYVDVLDDSSVHVKLGSIYQRLKELKKVNVLAMTTEHKKWLESHLPNKIVHIPHQHMNFERIRRTRREVITAGYIGTYVGRHEHLCKELETLLPLKFIYLFSYPTREDIIRFYQSIDIQVIPMFGHLTNVPYYHEKKIVDAMSFGIPTISEERLGYKDIDDYYIKVKDRNDILTEIVKLQSGWDAERLINKAEDYHISKIAKLYERLEAI